MLVLSVPRVMSVSSMWCVRVFQGKTGFGMPRNTQTKVDFADRDKQWLIEEQKQYSDAIVRLQSGTNQFESQKVPIACLFFSFGSLSLNLFRFSLLISVLVCCFETRFAGEDGLRNATQYTDQG